MGHILLWAPLAWTVRLLLLVNAGGMLYISALYLARFLRPANARILVSGGLPDFRRVEGTGKVLGQELTINADLEEAGIDRLTALDQRITVLEGRFDEVRRVAGQLLDKPNAAEESHG